MCGIAGIHSTRPDSGDRAGIVEGMLGMLRHRGPDEFGLYHDPHTAMGSARLRVIDLVTGTQPIGNEDDTVWIVFNGEIFNHEVLRRDLVRRGHRFRTHTDTEVVVHLYEEQGPDCVDHLNGQFAFAIWDRRQPEGTLFLARDRVGICPLFYTEHGSELLFASEAKALLAHPGVTAELDPLALAELFTLWSPLPPRTPFAGIKPLPPGHTLTVRGHDRRLRQYWEPSFPEAGEPPSFEDGEFIARLSELLLDATRLRLRADVPVGAYLSGGLDSTATTAMMRRVLAGPVKTFSVAFRDGRFDERAYQEEVAQTLGTDHSVLTCSSEAIGERLPEVIWHTESPLLRSAPVPMYLLSGHVQAHGLKVVLTGEGADEFLGGYNIFKEAKVRRFWARQPHSTLRPRLLNRLYGYVDGLDAGRSMRDSFFGRHLTEVDRLDYSHVLRWANTAPLRRLLSRDIRESLEGYEPRTEIGDRLAAHARFKTWTPLAQAQYLEATLFMPGCLLSSQGDRMLMAHSVEGRFPFLDHRVIEWAAQMPPRLKIRGLTEKWALKQAVGHLVPDSVIRRPKQPYRAPIRDLFTMSPAGWVADAMSEQAVRRTNIFDPAAVDRLMEKAARGLHLGERDTMGLMAVASTQLLHERFIRNPTPSTSRPILTKHVTQQESSHDDRLRSHGNGDRSGRRVAPAR